LVAEPFRFERRARDPRALSLLALAGLAVLVLVLAVETAWWIPAGIGLLALPAALEALRDSRSGLAIDAGALSWWSGRRTQAVPRALIAEVVLATGLDFSQRGTVRLHSGERLRIPPESLPPGRRLDAALSAAGLPHRRSLFGS
jgi:hypothetical protein